MRGWTARLSQSRTLAEQVQAYLRLRRQLENYCRMRVPDFDDHAAAEFQRLRKSRIRIGTMNLKIAAIVLAHDATLLTRNLGDFGRVPGLKVEDWSA
ncbi:hypothetical protein BH23PLA1_BH23PLA1_39090 [soil metagenome]